MKKYLTIEEIKKIFSDPNLLKKGQKIWCDAERKGIPSIEHAKLKKGTNVRNM